MSTSRLDPAGRPGHARRGIQGLPVPSRLLGGGLAVVVAVAVLWGLALLHTPADSGSLDARVNAVGATVRCPICTQPIPLNDVQNPQALQMRAFIRAHLRQGASEDMVQQQLVARYGTSILLAPPQQGFDLLVWAVPLAAVVACAGAVFLAARRWAGNGKTDYYAPATAPQDPEAARYERLLDQELARRG